MNKYYSVIVFPSPTRLMVYDYGNLTVYSYYNTILVRKLLGHISNIGSY
jgi:hypothetical protein